MNDAAITLVVLAVVVVLFVWNRLPIEIIAIGSALALFVLGVLDFTEAIAGFGDSTVVMIAALFVVSEGLDSTGVTAWIGQRLITLAGDSKRRLLVFTMLLAAGLTAMINLNGAVAALLPMAVMVAVRQQLKPSRLLMPMVFAASAGSLLLLTGSPVNVIFADSAEEAGVGRFGFAEFALVGIPAVAGAMVLLTLFADRLLPDRGGDPFRDLSQHAGTLVRHYALERFAHLRLRPESGLMGQARGSWDLSSYPGLNVITVLDGESGRPVSDGLLGEGDRLTVTGARPDIERFAADQQLSIEAVHDREAAAAALVNKEQGVAEVVIPPRSRLIGETVRPGLVVAGSELLILGVQRQGRDRGAAETTLKVGDTLLIEGRWSSLDERAGDADVLVVDSPELIRRQGVPLGPRSKIALAVLGAMFALLATSIVPAAMAALLAAGAMIVLRVLTVEQAYRRISWSTVLLIAGMLPMSTAIKNSGAGDLVAGLIVGLVDDAGPYALLIALFIVTVVFGQLISNTATALVMIPIAVSAAAQLDLSARPVLMSLCVASVAAFLTPIATPANMMIMGPAGYRFGDYWKLGLVMVALFFVISVGLVPLIWRF